MHPELINKLHSSTDGCGRDSLECLGHMGLNVHCIVEGENDPAILVDHVSLAPRKQAHEVVGDTKGLSEDAVGIAE